jgi:hypothetical protein
MRVYFERHEHRITENHRRLSAIRSSDGSSLTGVALLELLGEHSAMAPHVDLGVD